MASLLYFVPNRDDILNVSKIPAECNLSETLRGASETHRQVNAGPDKLPGMLLSIHPAPKSNGEEATCAFDEEAQDWFRVEDATGKLTHFVGFEKAKPPRPEDLLRAASVGGLPVELKGTFLVPVILWHLPQTFRF